MTLLDYETRPSSTLRSEQSESGLVVTFPVLPFWVAIFCAALLSFGAIINTVLPIYFWIQENRLNALFAVTGAPIFHWPVSVYVIFGFYALINWFNAATCAWTLSRQHLQPEVWQVAGGRLLVDRHRWGRLRRREYDAAVVESVQAAVLRDLFTRRTLGRLVIRFRDGQPIRRRLMHRVADADIARSVAASFRKALNLPESQD